MAVFRHGDFNAFWDGTGTFNQSTNPVGGVGVTTGATSQVVQIGRGGDNFSFYVRVTSAPAFVTTWTLQVAHSGDPNAEGNVDQNAATSTYFWHDATYLGNTANGVVLSLTVPSGGGALMSFVPDFTAGWVRLKRTDAGAAVNVVAGYEVQGD